MHITTKTATSRRRIGLAGAIGLAGLGVLAQEATTQVVVSGDAQACFGAGCTPLDNHRIDVAGVWLKYISAPTLDFQGITAGGLLDIDNSLTAGNFGRFEVGPLPWLTAINIPFTLSLSYLSPETPNSLFSALMTGTIGSHRDGVAYAIFDPPSVTGPFQDPNSALEGDMTVTAYNVRLPSATSAPITGLIQVSNTVPYTVTPEPVTVVLLATGLFGLAVVRRRRKTDLE
jgi:hypothetical protein